ncbi:MAG: XkdX family protein [Fibrobacter sp.]|nr:XkdX family protein [Clostridia bacterium]MBR2731994.1 XkdX family protein [Clostridia bacterium]MBR3038561.1 XkdX family protein [Clostridia bacterium]MBR4680736.1 XkdX family protein [Fibrobacter sp.]
MSEFAEQVKEWHENGVKPWGTKKAVANAVKKGRITEEEYAEIVGEPYDG